MAFHFSLETLLRVRHSQEKREELLLQNANRKVAAILREIEKLDGFLKDRQNLRGDELHQGAFAAELHFGLLGDEALQHRRQALSEDLARAEALRDQQRDIYRRARADREAVETIRDHQFSLYRQQRDRRGQRDLDNFFLMRREFLKRG